MCTRRLLHFISSHRFKGKLNSHETPNGVLDISNWRRTSQPQVKYIPRTMHTVFALLCFVVVIYWLIFPNPSGLLHWHCGNLTIAPVPAKQPWWILINTSCEFIMNECITTTKQSTTKPCAYFLGYTVYRFVCFSRCFVVVWYCPMAVTWLMITTRTLSQWRSWPNVIETSLTQIDKYIIGIHYGCNDNQNKTKQITP